MHEWRLPERVAATRRSGRQLFIQVSLITHHYSLAGAAEEEEESFGLLAGDAVLAGVVEDGEGIHEAVAAAEFVAELRHGTVRVLGVGIVEEARVCFADSIE